MKKLHKFLFKNPTGEMLILQVFFFGGLIAGSTHTSLNLLIGLIWISVSTLWMFAKTNNWNK
jgi:hypothetical protein